MDTLDVEKIRALDEAIDAVIRYDKDGHSRRSIGKIVFRTQRYGWKYASGILARIGLLPKRDVTFQTFWGADMTAPLNDVDTSHLYLFGLLGGPEYKLTRFLTRFLQADDVVFDVGANYGFYSLLAKECGSRTVHAFEPSPRVFGYLEKNVPQSNGVQLNRLALSSAEGEITFFDTGDSGHTGTSTSSQEVADAAGRTFERISVPATTLDAYTEHGEMPTFLKIDVEGAEKDVLLGALKTIEHAKPVISLEAWGGKLGERFSRPATTLLSEWGYVGYGLSDDGQLVKLDEVPDQQVGVFGFDNFIFAPPGHSRIAAYELP